MAGVPGREGFGGFFVWLFALNIELLLTYLELSLAANV